MQKQVYSVYKEIDSVFVVTYNTRIHDDAHTTEIVEVFADKDSALDFTVESNVNEKAKGNYNWYAYYEMQVN